MGEYLSSVLRMDSPPESKNVVTTNVDLDSPVFSKFHNPLEMTKMFDKCNFQIERIHWYHYHPAMPTLENKMKTKFREEAIRLEHESSDWRGMFLCSAFVVEAVKK